MTPQAPPFRDAGPRSASVGGSSPLAPLLFAIALVAFGPAAPPAVADTVIRADGLLEVDGEPFFPVGLVELGSTRYPDWNERIRQSGANLIWDIELAYADTMPTCSAILDSAQAAGYRLMIGSGDTWNWDDHATPELEVDRMMYEQDEVPPLLSCLSAHPDRVVAWVNRDEPAWTISRNMIGDIDRDHVYETYSQIHAFDPGTVVATNFAPAHLTGEYIPWVADIDSMLGATDVVMFASYPYPPGPGTCQQWNVLGYPECKLDRLVESADVFLEEVNHPGQPLWMIVQAFKGIPLKEARWEAYASLVHGATGLFWAGWTWSHSEGGGPANWPITAAVVSEVSALRPYLLGEELPGSFATDPLVETRAKWGGGPEAITIAISREGFAGEVDIRVPRVRSAYVEVVGEGRTLPVWGNRLITDTFEEYEAHVYRYKALRNSSSWGATDAPEVVPEAGGFRIRTHPNPSPGRVFARFELPTPTAAIFTVVDAAGRRVALLANGSWEAGSGELVWSGRDSRGRLVAPGVYFVRGTTADGRTATARTIILR